MQKATRKIIISLLTIVLVFTTMFATTFAWVGILTYSSTDYFNFNLKVEDLNNSYFLTISSTGIPGSYGEEIPLDEIQKNIMNNLEIDYDTFIDINNPEAVNEFFKKKTHLKPVTTSIRENIFLDNFYEFENLTIPSKTRLVESKSYFKFDIYLSVDSKEGIQNSTEINSNVALNEIVNSLQGTICSSQLYNGDLFQSLPSYDRNKYPLLNDISTIFTIDSASSARFALQVFAPIDINSDYSTETPYKLLIYQGGTSEPSYSNGIYSFGGILPEEYNFAVQQLNRMYNNHLKIENKYLNRNDLELIESNKLIWQAPNDYSNGYLGVHNGIQTKMKISVYFWFEGWDADCVDAIDFKNVTLNLRFTADIEE